MATHWEIAIAGQERDYARYAAEAAFRELDRLEGLLSRFVESSDVARANCLERGATTSISPETLECLLIAADIALATDRAFDPAYASTREPGDTAPAPFTLDPESFTLTAQCIRLHLDLGAVGKGYGLDRMADVLHEWKIISASLNAGGSSLLAFGEPESGCRGWPAALGEGVHRRVLALNGASLSGSGTAVKGEHLIDPRRGAPATRTSRTWAIAPTAAQADALSTAFFIMSEGEISALCTAHPQLGAAISGRGGELVSFGSLSPA